MKIFYGIILVFSILFSFSTFAEKGDIEMRFEPAMCEIVNYRCYTDENKNKRYGWSYYGDEKGCGCQQILSDKEISTLKRKTVSLIIAIDTVFPKEEARTKLLKRIKSYLITQYRNTVRQKLLTEIILDKLYEAYGDF